MARKYVKKSKSEVREQSFDHLNMWQSNPSYKEINIKLAVAKIMWLVLIALAINMLLLYLKVDLLSAIGATIVVISFFLMAFKEGIFSLNNLFWFRYMVSFDPFKDIKFVRTQEDSYSIYFVNKRDLTVTGLRIFKIIVIPPNVKAYLNSLIRGLYKSDISYTYQVIQKPSIRTNGKRQDHSGKYIQIYFCFYKSLNGILTNSRITKISDKLDIFSGLFSSNFKTSFNHFKVKLLSGNSLIDALQVFVANGKKTDNPKEDYSYEGIEHYSGLTLKMIFCCFLTLFVSYILFNMHFSFLIIICINLIVLFSLIFIWWREALFVFSKACLTKSKRLKVIQPYKRFAFFKLRNCPDTLFMHINERLLIASKMYNLIQAAPPVVNKEGEYIIKPDKFFRAMVESNFPFSYNLNLIPIDFHCINKKSNIKNLKQRFQNELFRANTKQKGEKWLRVRAGVWQTFLTLELSSHVFTKELNESAIKQLEKTLKADSEVMEGVFQEKCPEYFFVPLRNNNLISGYKLLSLKGTYFRIGGSHLNYLLFAGTTLIALSVIAGEFRRGVKIKIAAEFNIPLGLKNEITYGRVLNTESLEKEIPAGFSMKQIKNLLITNGTTTNRQELAMKLVSELSLCGIPSIIFDFRGNWSRIVRYLKDTDCENNFVLFKLGTTFNINPLHSEIPYDQNKSDYINYLVDAYRMAFKQDRGTANALRETLLDSLEKEVDIATVIIDLQGERKWEKNPYSHSIVSLFKEFNERLTIFSKQFDNSEVLEFIKNDKTVILDLSVLNDLEQKTFITFILISKFIHYISFHDDYRKKLLVIPHTDLFFDSFYVDKYINYGKVSNFLDPLFDNGFGIILTSNQVRYLHPNVFNYFNNIITFRATDKRDIAMLKNQMNLQELHGVGIYSTSRKESYQIDFIKELKKDEVVVKRYDLNQPFPAKIDVKKIRESNPLSYAEIVNYMRIQGFDLKNVEKTLLDQAEKTIFERDFGRYAVLDKALLNFLRKIKELDKIPLYKPKLKEELKNYIYSKASKVFSQDKKTLRKIRDDLFEILVQQGYLVESHPKSASGSQVVRTAYSVGPQYDRAVEDYFQSNQDKDFRQNFEAVEINSESNFKKIFGTNLTNEIKKENGLKLKKLLTHLIGTVLISELSTMRDNIENKNYEKALFLQRDFGRRFIVSLYLKQIGSKEKIDISDKKISEAIKYLFENFELPFAPEEIETIINMSKIGDLTGEDFENRIRDNYNSCLEFFYKIKKVALEG